MKLIKKKKKERKKRRKLIIYKAPPHGIDVTARTSWKKKKKMQPAFSRNSLKGEINLLYQKPIEEQEES